MWQLVESALPAPSWTEPRKNPMPASRRSGSGIFRLPRHPGRTIGVPAACLMPRTPGEPFTALDDYYRRR